MCLLGRLQCETKRFIFEIPGDQSGEQLIWNLPEEYVLKHCESCYHLNNLSSMSAESRQFVQKRRWVSPKIVSGIRDKKLSR